MLLYRGYPPNSGWLQSMHEHCGENMYNCANLCADCNHCEFVGHPLHSLGCCLYCNYWIRPAFQSISNLVLHRVPDEFLCYCTDAARHPCGAPPLHPLPLPNPSRPAHLAPVRRLTYSRSSGMERNSQPPLPSLWSRSGNVRFKRKAGSKRAV